jgi:hypothetical protein
VNYSVSHRTSIVAALVVAVFVALFAYLFNANAEATVHVSHDKVSATQIVEVRALQSKVGKEWTLSYRAKWTYEYKGKVTSFTLEQAPPLTRFIAADGAWDETNRRQDFFSCASGFACPGVNGVDPLFQTRNLFVGVEASDELGGFNTTAANAPSGFSLKFSEFNFAGLNSTCVSIYDGNAFSQEWCVAKNGILTYGRYAGRLLVLTNYRRGMNPSLIKIPFSARMVSI